MAIFVYGIGYKIWGILWICTVKFAPWNKLVTVQIHLLSQMTNHSLKSLVRIFRHLPQWLKKFCSIDARCHRLRSLTTWGIRATSRFATSRRFNGRSSSWRTCAGSGSANGLDDTDRVKLRPMILLQVAWLACYQLDYFISTKLCTAIQK